MKQLVLDLFYLLWLLCLTDLLDHIHQQESFEIDKTAVFYLLHRHMCSTLPVHSVNGGEATFKMHQLLHILIHVHFDAIWIMIWLVLAKYLHVQSQCECDACSASFPAHPSLPHKYSIFCEYCRRGKRKGECDKLTFKMEDAHLSSSTRCILPLNFFSSLYLNKILFTLTCTYMNEELWYCHTAAFSKLM